MKRAAKLITLFLFTAFIALFVGKPVASKVMKLLGFDRVIEQNADRLMSDGRQTFRYDTFGDEAFWGGQLMLHDAIQGEKFGGVGPGVSPSTALAVGLKVDVDALPPGLVKQIRQGKVDLGDPASTLALLRHNAVVGVKGNFAEDDTLK